MQRHPSLPREPGTGRPAPGKIDVGCTRPSLPRTGRVPAPAHIWATSSRPFSSGGKPPKTQGAGRGGLLRGEMSLADYVAFMMYRGCLIPDPAKDLSRREVEEQRNRIDSLFLRPSVSLCERRCFRGSGISNPRSWPWTAAGGADRVRQVPARLLGGGADHLPLRALRGPDAGEPAQAHRPVRALVTTSPPAALRRPADGARFRQVSPPNQEGRHG
jgi:hypothetical protein